VDLGDYILSVAKLRVLSDRISKENSLGVEIGRSDFSGTLARVPTPKGGPSMAFFYEIRSADNTVLKRDGGFATQDAAKTAGCEDAKKMKNSRQPDRPDVRRIMVGQNTERPTRY
jgi:hypothetical protein